MQHSAGCRMEKIPALIKTERGFVLYLEFSYDFF